MDWDAIYKFIDVDMKVQPPEWATPGTTAGFKKLEEFVASRLKYFEGPVFLLVPTSSDYNFDFSSTYVTHLLLPHPFLKCKIDLIINGKVIFHKEIS